VLTDAQREHLAKSLAARSLRLRPFGETPSIVELLTEEEQQVLFDSLTILDIGAVPLKEESFARTYRAPQRLAASLIPFHFVVPLVLSFLSPQGMRHLLLYGVCSIYCLVLSLLLAARGEHARARSVFLLSAFGAVDFAAWVRFPIEAAVTLRSVQYPLDLWLTDIVAYLALAASATFALVDLKRRACTAFSIFSGLAVVYWLCIRLFHDSSEIIYQLVQEVWKSDVPTMTWLVVALYGTIAVVALILRNYKGVGVSWSSLAWWLVTPAGFYLTFGPWIPRVGEMETTSAVAFRCLAVAFLVTTQVVWARMTRVSG